MIKKAVAMTGSNHVRQISPTLHQAVDEEMRRDLRQTKLTGSNHWLVRFVPRFDNPVGGAHTNG